MKITSPQLKQIIAEELRSVLNETKEQVPFARRLELFQKELTATLTALWTHVLLVDQLGDKALIAEKWANDIVDFLKHFEQRGIRPAFGKASQALQNIQQGEFVMPGVHNNKAIPWDHDEELQWANSEKAFETLKARPLEEDDLGWYLFTSVPAITLVNWLLQEKAFLEKEDKLIEALKAHKLTRGWGLDFFKLDVDTRLSFLDAWGLGEVEWSNHPDGQIALEDVVHLEKSNWWSYQGSEMISYGRWSWKWSGNRWKLLKPEFWTDDSDYHS